MPKTFSRIHFPRITGEVRFGYDVDIRIAPLPSNPLRTLSVGKDTQFHKDKLMCARYWMERMVPECSLLLERIQAGSENVMQLE